MALLSIRSLALGALTSAFSLLVAQSNSTSQELAQMGNGIAAIAEGEVITVEALRRELEPIIPRLQVEARNSRDFAERVDKLSKEVLQNMIDRIIIVKAAEDEGILIPQSYIDQEYDEVIARDFGGDRARFLEYLKTQNKTPRDFRQDIYNRIVVNVMRQRNRKSQSEISPERIEEFYVKNKVRFYQNEAMHLRQIILSPTAGQDVAAVETTVETIMDALNGGANFADLARQYSQDEMSRRGGDWGWIERQDIRAELSQVAFELNPGEYSEPVTLGGTTFILYSENKREETIQPITQVREVIEEVLVGEIARETQERWLQEVRENAYVRYFL